MESGALGLGALAPGYPCTSITHGLASHCIPSPFQSGQIFRGARLVRV
jgi:hypothetical protein